MVVLAVKKPRSFSCARWAIALPVTFCLPWCWTSLTSTSRERQNSP